MQVERKAAAAESRCCIKSKRNTERAANPGAGTVEKRERFDPYGR
jgi:hypothetical protein